MKLIVAGSRTILDKDFVRKCILDFEFGISEIVSGLARGPDLLGKEIANELLIPVKEFPANWKEFGKLSGYKRNIEMADYADCLLAIWDGKSNGTKHMINEAGKRNLYTKVVIK